jgi:hypothetical protein
MFKPANSIQLVNVHVFLNVTSLQMLHAITDKM